MRNTKKKRGRKLASPQPRDNVVSVRFNDTELHALNTYCFRYDTSLSDVIRDALDVVGVIPTNPIR